MNGNLHRCAVCNQDVKLYRPYGEFLRSQRIKCREHIPNNEQDWHVPLIEDTDGGVWGFSSAPQSAIDKWNILPITAPLLLGRAVVFTLFVVATSIVAF